MTRRPPKTAETPIPCEPPPPDVAVRYFDLVGLLPPGYRFAYHERLYTLNLLCFTPEGPTLLLDQQFTQREATLLLPLLHAYPAYCPYAVLHASFTSTAVTSEAIVRSQQRLATSVHMGYGEQEMRPIRNVLSRMRPKLLAFQIDIATIQQVGSLLMAASPVPCPDPLVEHG